MRSIPACSSRREPGSAAGHCRDPVNGRDTWVSAGTICHYTPGMENSVPQLVTDYRQIAAAMAYLRIHCRQRPCEAALAAHLRLGEAQLHSLFHRFAGVGPQQFMRFLDASTLSSNPISNCFSFCLFSTTPTFIAYSITQML